MYRKNCNLRTLSCEYEYYDCHANISTKSKKTFMLLLGN